MKNTEPHVLMAAAECRDLAKVGGLGDVVRDLAKALKALLIPVIIVMPSYDQIQHPDEPVASLAVSFGARNDWPVKVFKRELDGVIVYLLRSDEFFGGRYGGIYIDSDRLGRGPFEDDAQRFAFFSVATLHLMQEQAELESITVLHCHDWHTGVMLVLLKHDPGFRQLAGRLKTLFTIHNLDYQGTRPFELSGDRPLLSFADWFPELYQNLKAGGDWAAVIDPELAKLLCSGGDIFLMPSDLALRHRSDGRDAVWMSATGYRRWRPV